MDAKQVADAALKLGGHRSSTEWLQGGQHRTPSQWVNNTDSNGNPRDVHHRTPWQWLTGQSGTPKK